MASIRAFVAINPDEAALRAITAFRDRLRAELPARGYRWVKDDQMHLTLRFMAELPEEPLSQLEERLARSCKVGGAFAVAAAFAGALWKGARVAALEVKAKGDELFRLQTRIEADARAIGLPAESKVFRPHLTLARLEDPRLQPQTPHGAVSEWDVEEVLLIESVLGPRGAAHSVLGRFPLQ